MKEKLPPCSPVGMMLPFFKYFAGFNRDVTGKSPTKFHVRPISALNVLEILKIFFCKCDSLGVSWSAGVFVLELYHGSHCCPVSLSKVCRCFSDFLIIALLELF